MTVKFDKLLRMAEQIAANISISDDEESVADQVTGHLQRYWDPRMREHFLDQASHHADQMSPVVKRVVEKLRAA